VSGRQARSARTIAASTIRVIWVEDFIMHLQMHRTIIPLETQRLEEKFHKKNGSSRISGVNSLSQQNLENQNYQI
jgi:hypothetical protein